MASRGQQSQLVADDQMMMTVNTGETVTGDMPNTKTIILKSHFMVKSCEIDLKTNYSEITVFCHILNEPLRIKSIIQAIVISKEKFIGIFTSDDYSDVVLV